MLVLILRANTCKYTSDEYQFEGAMWLLNKGEAPDQVSNDSLFRTRKEAEACAICSALYFGMDNHMVV